MKLTRRGQTEPRCCTSARLGVQLALAPSLRAQLFPPDHFSPPPPAFVQISHDHSLDPAAPGQPATLTHNIGLATASPYPRSRSRFPSSPARPVRMEHHPKGLDKVPPQARRPQLQRASTQHMTAFQNPCQMEDDPDDPYLVIAIVASSNAWYTWISPSLLGESSPARPPHLLWHRHGPSRRRPQFPFDNRTIFLSRNPTRWMNTMSLHVAVNGISSHQGPACNKWKKKGETAKE